MRGWLLGCVAAWVVVCGAAGQGRAAEAPWLDHAKSLEERARLLTAQLTQEEKLRLVHGHFAVGAPGARPAGALGSAGYVPGVPRLGIPDLQETDGPLGVVNPSGVARPGDTAVALPSGVAVASSFDPERAYADGAVLGREAAARGFNVVLGGGANLARDPRGGRNFEYAGEDPLLAGIMVGAALRGTADQHVIATIKHFAFNDQETDRTTYNVELDDDVRHGSDLLAFQIAIEQGHPGSVMCAYNKLGGLYACENGKLLTNVLKQDWGFPGFVMSDWGAVHSAAAAMNAGLDQESGEELDSQVFFGKPLEDALARGRVEDTRLDDAVARILRSMLAAGLLEHGQRPAQSVADDLAEARKTESEAIVLLSNKRHMLPIGTLVRPKLPPALQCVAVIGGESDAGVAAGGGSSMVTPIGGFARQRVLGGGGADVFFRNAGFDPPSPLSRIAAHAPGMRMIWVDGRYPSEAAGKARLCNAVFIFATQWSGENSDLADLSLPDGQDALIDAVTKANPNTVVVLETAGPVLMPWLDQAAAVLEAWYPGSGGADAIADVLFGAVSPSGRLAQSFPRQLADLPEPDLPGLTNAPGLPMTLRYHEGDHVGYRWFHDTGKKPLFPFGFGLTYTQFAYSGLKLSWEGNPGDAMLDVEFDVRNAGAAQGVAVPQAYLTTRGPSPSERLLGWQRISLKPGESHHVRLAVDRRLLATYVGPRREWLLAPLLLGVGVGDNAENLALAGKIKAGFATFKP